MDFEALSTSEYENCLSRAAVILDAPQQFSLDWLVASRFKAVPFESASHFDADDAPRFASAMRALSVNTVRLLVLDGLTDRHKSFIFPASEKALIDLSVDFGSFNLLLLPSSEAFAILCTSEEIGVVAGPDAFCEMALGTTIQEAREDFRSFLALPGTPPSLRAYYEAVDERYRGP